MLLLLLRLLGWHALLDVVHELCGEEVVWVHAVDHLRVFHEVPLRWKDEVGGGGDSVSSTLTGPMGGMLGNAGSEIGFFSEDCLLSSFGMMSSRKSKISVLKMHAAMSFF